MEYSNLHMHARLPALHTCLPPPDDHIATTPTHDLDQGHMSGAEEAPPTSTPAPAVVPSPDDGAKEITQHEADMPGGGVGVAEGAEFDEEEKFIDVEGDEVSSEGKSDRTGNITIDPSYNPNGEELLYEGDLEAEAPLAKPEKESGASSQDEGFMISVHETGMELDMAESLSESHTKAEKKAENGSCGSPRWRAGEGGAAASKTTSKSSTAESKRALSTDKVDRFVDSLCQPSSLFLPFPPSPPRPSSLPPSLPTGLALCNIIQVILQIMEDSKTEECEEP